ncbi:MAG TPA: hypothetical protein VKT73_07365 [Xanthobacteraceae bacterium]|nr:hypothetical protein [Xanthobacteraceae bacterium]
MFLIPQCTVGHVKDGQDSIETFCTIASFHVARAGRGLIAVSTISDKTLLRCTLGGQKPWVPGR